MFKSWIRRFLIVRIGDSEAMVRARFGNVAGILVCTEERPGEDVAGTAAGDESSPTSLGVGLAADSADALAQVFDETWVVGFAGLESSAESEWNPVRSESSSPLARLQSALVRTVAERVFVQAGAASSIRPISLDVLLAAIAWPEASISLIGAEDSVSFLTTAIARRSELMAAANEAVASGEASLDGLLARIATERLSPVDLGVADSGLVGPSERLGASSPSSVEGGAGGGR